MNINIQFERIDNGLFHSFANGHHIGIVAKQNGGFFFRSNTGFLSPTMSTRLDAVMTFPAISEYQY